MVLAFLLLISGFLLWFPVTVKRNVVVYITGFVLFYSSRSIGLLVNNVLPRAAYQQRISVVLLGFSLACLLLWLVGLRREGEEETTVTGPAGHAPALARLSAQLDEINTALAVLCETSGKRRHNKRIAFRCNIEYSNVELPRRYP